jgi:hypothetical protein
MRARCFFSSSSECRRVLSRSSANSVGAHVPKPLDPYILIGDSLLHLLDVEQRQFKIGVELLHGLILLRPKRRCKSDCLRVEDKPAEE